MWIYEKRLQYPVNITKTDARIAKIIATQYGGPDGEIGASMRYLSQRFTAPNRVCMAVLTDVATEELGHLEMVSTIVHQLTCNLSLEEIQNSGFHKKAADGNRTRDLRLTKATRYRLRHSSIYFYNKFILL